MKRIILCVAVCAIFATPSMAPAQQNAPQQQAQPVTPEDILAGDLASVIKIKAQLQAYVAQLQTNISTLGQELAAEKKKVADLQKKLDAAMKDEKSKNP